MRQAIALVLLLTACGRPPAPAPPGQPEALPHTLPQTTPRFVGRWAAAAEGCHEEAWQFREKGLVTPGRAACTFTDVRAAPGGYDVDAICTAAPRPSKYTLRLRFAESAGTMLVEGGPMAPVGLVACNGA